MGFFFLQYKMEGLDGQEILFAQDLALRIASLLQYFSSPSSAFQFLRCFYITMNREWNGIDNLRLNKFYSLQRRMVEESLKIAISDIFNQKNEDDENDEE